jgi:hypothetical protein
MVLVVSRARTGPGQRSSDKEAKKVIGIHKEGLSYRLIGRNVGLSKNTVIEIVKQRNSDDMQSRDQSGKCVNHSGSPALRNPLKKCLSSFGCFRRGITSTWLVL